MSEVERVNELIWHFIGYLHIEDLLNKAIVSYSGAGALADAEIHAIGSRPVEWSEPDVPDSLKPLIEQIFIFSQDPVFRPSIEISPSHYADARIAPPTDGSVVLPSALLDFPPVPVFLTVTAAGEIQVMYNLGGLQNQIVDISQLNWLMDNDMLLSAGISNVAGVDSLAVAKAMGQLLDLAEAHMPAHDADPAAEFAQLRSGSAYPDQDHTAWTWSETHDTAGTASYHVSFLNGEEQPTDGSPQPGAGVLTSEPEIDSGSTQGVIITEGGQTIKLPGETDAPIEQSATLGGNSQLNAAVVFNQDGYWGSIIVQGDYWQSNLIAQINVLNDKDTVEMFGYANVDLSFGENTVTNSAEFFKDTDPWFGDAAMGIPVGPFWNVDYIEGDVLKIYNVTQTNVMAGNDLYTQTAVDHYFAIGTGENDQINISTVLNFSQEYDLIIIGGDYLQINKIYQMNILLDSDYLMLVGPGGEDGEATLAIYTGGNELSNEAFIWTLGGGALFSPITDDAAALADLIADQADTIDPALVADLPGNGTMEFNVLYISGDFYEYSSVYQTNIMADMDTVYQLEPTLEDGNFEKTVSTGGNELVNFAGIVNAQSSSHYQFLGGNYYEESMLIQSEFMSAEESVKYLDEGEAGAVIAALLTEMEGPEEEPLQSPASTANDDLLGSVLA